MLTVVICTRNRARLLSGALRTLDEQQPVDSNVDFLVVDNQSSDNTREVVESFAGRVPEVRYCLEERLGLSHARNRGVTESSSKYVAFVDDDCELPPDWLRTALRLLNTFGPLALGGPFFPLFEIPPPSWYREEYGTRQVAAERSWLLPGKYLIGCNMIFARSVLEQIPFSGALGMAGDAIAYGEEVEVQRRLDEQFGRRRRLYDPDLKVKHLTRRDQVNFSWLMRSCFAKGRDVYTAAGGQPLTEGRLSARIDLLKSVAAMTQDMVLGCLRRDRASFPQPQNYWYEHSGQYLKRIGRLNAQLRKAPGS